MSLIAPMRWADPPRPPNPRELRKHGTRHEKGSASLMYVIAGKSRGYVIWVEVIEQATP